MSFFDIWPWWVWALNTFGIIGIIVFIAAAPALAARIAAAVLKFLDEAIRTPLGAGLISGALMFGLAWWWQGDRLETLCNARIAEARQAGIDAGRQRDTTVAKNASRFDATALGWIDTAAIKREEIVNAQPKPVANADCRKLGPGGLKWLRAIAPD